MHRTSAVLLPVAVALWILPAAAPGQDAGDWATYRALTQTPLGAFTSPFNVSITGIRAHSLEWRARYGMMTYDRRAQVQTFGVTLAVPAGDAALSFTAGYFMPTCARESCSAHVMASAAVSERLIGIQLGRGDEGGAFNIGFQGTLGFAKDGATLASAHAEFPLSLVPTKRSLRLVPYVAPGVGLGWARDSTAESGMLFTIGAGLGLVASSGVRMSVGIRRVFVPGRDNWLVGVDLALGGGH
jgi:hypothetical protein